jgi:hypothetical protein
MFLCCAANSVVILDNGGRQLDNGNDAGGCAEYFGHLVALCPGQATIVRL